MSNNISFTGYDARPLKGIFTRDGGFGKSFYGLASQTAEILNKEGVDVFIQTPKKILKNEFPDAKPNFSNFWPWVQDRLAFFPNKTIESKGFTQEDTNLKDIKEMFKLPIEEKYNHVEGGNYFFIKDGGKEVVLLGKEELSIKSPKSIQDFFGKHKVITVSQPDFHLDLSIRPLNNKRILVNDPKMLLSELEKGINRAKDIFAKSNDSQLEGVIRKLNYLKEEILESDKQYNTPKRYKTLQQELKYNKFNVIKVPGLIVKPNSGGAICGNIPSFLEDIKYKMNFMNSIVHERADKSLVYVAGKSVLDEQLGLTPEIAEKIDFSFERIFKKSLNGIIAPDDIHFVGDKTISNLLKNNDGSVHCLFAEIPKD